MELIPIKITLPPIPNVSKYVPVHRLAAIMAALGYSDASYFAKELKKKDGKLLMMRQRRLD